MAVTATSSAPYAPPSAIMEVVNRFRRGLPAPITGEVLGRAGISDSLIPRTLQALQTLDLITDEGAATPTLEGLRRAPEPEFQKRLAEWLNTAYADVLSYIDPATADEGAIRDAFRNYNPVGQQPRMVTLYIGLYTAAGVRSSETSQATRAPRATSPKPRARGMISKSGSGGRTTSHVKPSTSQNINGVPQPIAGLLSSLPDEGSGWTQEKRDKFMTTFGTVVDFCFPIVDNDEDADEGAEVE